MFFCCFSIFTIESQLSYELFFDKTSALSGKIVTIGHQIRQRPMRKFSTIICYCADTLGKGGIGENNCMGHGYLSNYFIHA